MQSEREYRKTATIRAVQWWRMGDHPAVVLKSDPNRYADEGIPWIDTLEGGHVVTPGDWIATGVKGEHWPIKPDVFAASYKPVTRTDAAPDGLVAIVKHMANRFLMWKLPKPFRPDNRISFDPPVPINPGTPYENDCWPTGTNLFGATEAEAMVRHMIEGLPMSEAANRITALEAALAERDATIAGLREVLGEVKDGLAAAYVAGCEDVHEHWSDDQYPEFGEAASDYATGSECMAVVRAALRTVDGEAG